MRDNRLISTTEAAEVLRCTTRTVLLIERRGELRAVVTYLGAQRRLHFDRGEVHELARRRVPELSDTGGRP